MWWKNNRGVVIALLACVAAIAVYALAMVGPDDLVNDQKADSEIIINVVTKVRTVESREAYIEVNIGCPSGVVNLKHDTCVLSKEVSSVVRGLFTNENVDTQKLKLLKAKSRDDLDPLLEKLSAAVRLRALQKGFICDLVPESFHVVILYNTD